jgi:hypothetical protein
VVQSGTTVDGTPNQKELIKSQRRGVSWDSAARNGQNGNKSFRSVEDRRSKQVDPMARTSEEGLPQPAG